MTERERGGERERERGAKGKVERGGEIERLRELPKVRGGELGSMYTRARTHTRSFPRKQAHTF